MDRKKLFRIVIITLAILLLIGILIYVFFNQSNEDQNNDIIREYTPSEEITGEQMRQTIVTLYYNQKETNTLMPEARLIDAKLLTQNPYKTLIDLLISQPKNDKLETCIPKDTRINKVEIKNDIVYVDFSNEFVTNHVGGEEKEKQTIDAIVNTVTELNEVKYVRILIEGEENLAFQDNLINFKENFKRND